MERKVQTKIKGYRTVDGAGVSLVRVLGNQTMEEFDPILMLDSFDSTNPKDYGLTCNLLTLALLCKSFRYAGENIQCC